MHESTIGRTRQSLSQLALAFAGVGLLFGLLVMSPDGRFAGFMVVAISGAGALISGPRRYRSIGAVAALISVVGAFTLSGEIERSPYRMKARVEHVYLLGSQYSAASGSFRQRTHRWPGSLGDLGTTMTSKSMRSVAMGPAGAITIVLSLPPLESRSLLFTPLEEAGIIHWTCSSNDIPKQYLPAACKGHE